VSTVTAWAWELELPPAAMAALEMARTDVLGLGLPAGERAFSRQRAPGWAAGFSWLADVVYAEAREHVDVGPAREALVNWNAWLQPHSDKTAPYPCLNAAVFFRHEATGGLLHIDGIAPVACLDGTLVLFDGGLRHEVTPVHPLTPGGYRASVVFYLPLADGGGAGGRVSPPAGAPSDGS